MDGRLLLLNKDASIYLDVVAGIGCFGFLWESWMERPVTRLMVKRDNHIGLKSRVAKSVG
ncbi:hypothetical protein B1F75_15130 [Pseudomonas syringae]|nr:hypothetical protein A3SK_0119315 [Pseudomonas amygdali pv. tabaci str. 6605]RXT62911.1 hypothetical protein B1F71_23670 [Pseudomonas syringae]RXT92532.1 hypothetical protein B1F75_15130 [Pseudomonas syringae]